MFIKFLKILEFSGWLFFILFWINTLFDFSNMIFFIPFIVSMFTTALGILILFILLIMAVVLSFFKKIGDELYK